MKEIIFNTVEKNLKISRRFHYCINPEDYISLTKELLNNRNLFGELAKISKNFASNKPIDKEKSGKLIKYAQLLKKYEHINLDQTSGKYISDILKDFETYSYFYKEVGASLKFNPLSKSDSGNHILEKIFSLLKEYAGLIDPKVLFRFIEVIPDENGLHIAGTDIQFRNKKLRIFISHSTASGSRKIKPEDMLSKNVIVYIVTIGPGIDDEVKKLMKKGEMFDAYILNGIGAGAAEMVANDLNRYMNNVNTKKNYEYKRLSPGYGNWNVSDQTKIFRLLHPEKHIGVKLTDSFIMLPEKSTSGIMGLTLKENSE